MGGSRKLIYGFGVNDWHTKINTDNGVIPEYEIWRGLLKRVYCSKTKDRHPSYVGNSIDPRWHSMTAFIEDVSTLVGYEQAITDKWHLDKDILGGGSKHYSLQTCCFVPHHINTMIANNTTRPTNLPLGVRKRSECNSYVARLCKPEGRVYLGDFKTPEKAFYAYKQAKEAYIKEVANKWKDQIDPRVYDALMNWEIISLT